MKMTDETKKTSDDEYQFPHDEYVVAEQEETAPAYEFTPEASADAQTETVNEAEASESTAASASNFVGKLGRLAIFKNKRVLFVIGAAVIAIIAFKIMTPSHKVKVVKQQPVQAVVPQDTDQTAMLNRLNRLSQDASSSQNVVTQLKSQLSDMKSSLNSASANEAAMRSAIVALAQQVQGLTNQIKAQNLQPHKKAYSPYVTYHLVAMVPGRAWIVGSNGESDTVVVGSKLAHYGAVKSINTEMGKVFTESGKVITYNAQGN